MRKRTKRRRRPEEHERSRHSLYNRQHTDTYQIAIQHPTFGVEPHLHHHTTTLSKPKLGRPSKISKRATRVVNRDLERSPKKTNRRILEENNLDFSTRSLQRLLRSEKYSISTAKKKQLLNKEKALLRKRYVKKTIKILKYIHFNKVIFLDKSSIQRRHGTRQEYVRKRRNKKTRPKQVSTSNTSKIKKNLNKLN